jgi:hypothetical protein
MIMMRVEDCMHSVVLLDDRVGVVLPSPLLSHQDTYSAVGTHTLPMDLDMSRQGHPCHELAV